MIRTATRDDLPQLRALFASSNDAPYDLAAVAEEKCFGAGIAGEPVVRVIGESAIQAAAVRCGKWLRLLVVARDARRRGLGTALLNDAAPRVIAAEPGNYFTPGVPIHDTGARAFLERHRYVGTATTWNLEVRPMPAHEERVKRVTERDKERFLTFVEREFGRIWRFEAAKAFERDVPPAFAAEVDGEIAGFVVHDVNNRGLGFFGPTGVARNMRGRGLGRALLLASLADLRAMGFARVVIPWTDALEFYRRSADAVPAHQFATYEKQA